MVAFAQSSTPFLHSPGHLAITSNMNVQTLVSVHFSFTAWGLKNRDSFTHCQRHKRYYSWTTLNVLETYTATEYSVRTTMLSQKCVQALHESVLQYVAALPATACEFGGNFKCCAIKWWNTWTLLLELVLTLQITITQIGCEWTS